MQTSLNEFHMLHQLLGWGKLAIFEGKLGACDYDLKMSFNHIRAKHPLRSIRWLRWQVGALLVRGYAFQIGPLPSTSGLDIIPNLAKVTSQLVPKIHYQHSSSSYISRFCQWDRLIWGNKYGTAYVEGWKVRGSRQLQFLVSIQAAQLSCWIQNMSLCQIHNYARSHFQPKIFLCCTSDQKSDVSNLGLNTSMAKGCSRWAW